MRLAGSGLLGVLGLVAVCSMAGAQDLGKIVMPIPEAPALSVEVQKGLDEVAARVAQIDTAGLVAQLAARPETVVIDVRTPAELVTLGGRISTARFVNITRGWLEFQIGTAVPDKATPIIVYCGVNQRSLLAADALTRLGYSDVKSYRDGFFNWRRAGLPVVAMDDAPESFLYSLPQEVIPGVWSAIGATAPGTYDNGGHNNNLTFVITEEGVLVVNGGDNYLLAQALHDEIRKRTDKPVKYVVLENSQGHAMLGSGYWKAQGATIIAHKDTLAEIKRSGERVLQSMRARMRDKAYRTELVLPDKTYDDKLEIKMGSWTFEVLHLGPSHSHGDTMVWMPDKKVVIAGDTAFHVRMLPLFEDTRSAKWIETWPKFEALGARIVVPGHGGPTDMATVTRWTRDYLVFLRQKVGEVIKSGGTLNEAYKIDQSDYRHLHTFDELALRNAARVFQEMEFE